MFDTVTAIVVSAIVLGSLYSLLASGLSLIWSTLGVFNYAHGAMLIVGAYLIWTLSVQVGLPVIVAFVISIPLLAVFGIVLEFVAVRPFLKRHNGTLLVMVSTLAVASMVQGAAQLIFGPQNRQIPPITDAVFRIGNVSLAATSLIGFVLALVLISAVILVLKRTEWGASIRAVEQNRDMSLLIGIQPKRVYAAVFVIAAVLAAAAALIYGTTTTITPAKGFAPLLTAFVVLVFGGSATLKGTIIGAFTIGLLEAATTYFFGLQWSPVAVFLVLVTVMLVRPEGLIKGRTS
jgi:branched-chain amino acid transport system permease protein